MKHFAVTSLLCALLVACLPANGQTVQIQQPSNNATLDWPFHLQASCTTSGTITGWDVYLDGTPTPYYKDTSSSKTLNILVQAATGSHALQAKCWVGSANGFANLTVNVTGGGLIPMPPSTATPYWNLDNLPLSDWGYCISIPSCTDVAPTTYTLTDVTSPSLDGTALDAYTQGPAYWGILWYTHVGAQDTKTHFEVQWSFYVQAGASPQALEFDFPVWIGGKSYYFGTQCNLRGTPSGWNYWDGSKSSWEAVGTACSISDGAWHTLKWYGTIDTANSTYSYNALQFDNTQYNVNITGIDVGTTTYGDNFTVQFQADGNGTGVTSYNEYVDEVSAWTW